VFTFDGQIIEPADRTELQQLKLMELIMAIRVLGNKKKMVIAGSFHYYTTTTTVTESTKPDRLSLYFLICRLCKVFMKSKRAPNGNARKCVQSKAMNVAGRGGKIPMKNNSAIKVEAFKIRSLLLLEEESHQICPIHTGALYRASNRADLLEQS